MKSAIPSLLQTALKVSFSASFAWAICQFLGFSMDFVAVIAAAYTTLAGLGVGWYLLTKGSAMIVIGFSLGVLATVLLGNNYITIFIVVLCAGGLWHYLQLHGFIGSFLGLMIKMPVVVIHSNSPDPVTMAFNGFMAYFIGVLVGMVFNRLFWPTINKQGLQQQLEELLSNSSLLLEKIFVGYLERNFDDSEAQELRAKILKNVQSSQKLFKIGTFDPTGRQLGQVDWIAILGTEQNISLHLSAILRLVQTSRGVEFPPELLSSLQILCNSIMTAFSQMASVMMNPNKAWNLSQLNSDFYQFKETLAQLRETDEMSNLPLSEILTFYSITHRLEKLVDEINRWGIPTKGEQKLEFTSVTQST
ncbi:MAG: hypothetical protein SWJ54_22855 [Cyanobacteriota bacterium]|nr:hypothetical protein [Cyanobacteriota bacterium]